MAFRPNNLLILGITLAAGLLLYSGGMMRNNGSDDPVLKQGLDDDQIRLDGLKRYNEACLQCHGVEGRGSSFGPALVHRLYGRKRFSDQAFIQAVLYGAPERLWDYGAMDPVKDLNQVEIAQILAYIRSRQQALAGN